MKVLNPIQQPPLARIIVLNRRNSKQPAGLSGTIVFPASSIVPRRFFASAIFPRDMKETGSATRRGNGGLLQARTRDFIIESLNGRAAAARRTIKQAGEGAKYLRETRDCLLRRSRGRRALENHIVRSGNAALSATFLITARRTGRCTVHVSRGPPRSPSLPAN